MNNISSLEKRLQELEEEGSKYRNITNTLFDKADLLTEEERVVFIAANKDDIEKLNVISREIRDIRWKLMTPQQQKDYLEKHS